MYVSYNDINGHHCQYNFARSSLLWEFNLLLVVERVSHLLFKADKFQTWKIKNISGYSHKQKKGVLSVEEKVKLIWLMENGRKKADTCGCETWSLTLREERKLRVFENMVLRRIFRTRRDEVTGEWRRLHNEELNDLFSSPNIVRVIKSRRMRWAGHVARMGN